MVKYLCGFFLFCWLLAPLGAIAGDDGLVQLKVTRYDSLIGISKRYLAQPEQWREIARLNRLQTPYRLIPGQILRIPVALLKVTPLRGTVTFLKGSAWIQAVPGAPWQPLQPQEVITEGMALKTGQGGSLEVGFEDGSAFLLRENAQIMVKQARKGPLHLVRVVFLKSGKVISRIKAATGRDSRFEIETPSAVAAARGTHYRVAVDEQETTRAELLESVVDLSAAGAVVILHEGEGSLARPNEQPLAPVNLLPSPVQTQVELTNGGRQAQFRFSRVEGAVRYRVSLSYDQEAKDAVKTELLAPDEVFSVAGLREGTYFLTASSIDSLGLEGQLSEPYPLTVQIAPLPPAWHGHMGEGDALTMPLELGWHPASDAAGYQLQIARDTAFTEPVIDLQDIHGTRYRLTGVEPGQYYARIRSLSSDRRSGPWSSSRPLVLVNLPAPLVKQESDDTAAVHLAWDDMPQYGGAYRLQIAKDGRFSETVIDEQLRQTFFDTAGRLEPAAYYMRVCGASDGILPEVCSETGRFKIEQPRRYYLEALGLTGIMLMLLLL